MEQRHHFAEYASRWTLRRRRLAPKLRVRVSVEFGAYFAEADRQLACPILGRPAFFRSKLRDLVTQLQDPGTPCLTVWGVGSDIHWKSDMVRTRQKPVRKPRMLVTAQNLELRESPVGRAFPSGTAAVFLEEELSCAVLVNETLSARPFCHIGSWVTYQDITSGQASNIQIVLPGDADIDKRLVSVLTPIDASLLGSGHEHEFSRTDHNGRRHCLQVIEVGSDRDA